MFIILLAPLEPDGEHDKKVINIDRGGGSSSSAGATQLLLPRSLHPETRTLRLLWNTIIESLITFETLGMQYNARRHHSRNIAPFNDALADRATTKIIILLHCRRVTKYIASKPSS